MAATKWTHWLRFPDPEAGGYLSAPFGPGVYELRNRKTGELVLVGKSKNVASRMSSLLPRPHGTGTRNNARKREYVRKHLDCLEYRTKACGSAHEAESVEREKRNTGNYLFPT